MTIEATIATNRFGLGARPGELSRSPFRPADWLKDQLQGPSRLPAPFQTLASSETVFQDVERLRSSRRASRRSGDDAPAPDIVQDYTRIVRGHYVAQTSARYVNAIETDYPFHERLVHFWSNHFAVSADKQPLTALAGAFENEAIRPNISGRFADLLMAVEKHPAMIVYLDNQLSIGPNTAAGRRVNNRGGNRTVGLNENLAREVLELHTLGVDGGYSQDDVTSFAKAITGWSVGGGERRRFREGKTGRFQFRSNMHEPGAHTVLGTRYEQEGIEQGEAVLNDLAAHPATARHVAQKLARHFVDDNPPAQLVDHLASVFLDSRGDLPTVHAALVDSKEAWHPAPTKYKTPHDFVVSTFRAFDVVPDKPRLITGALDLMGQTPYRPGSPAGWADTADEWGGADALYKRIEWANSVARFASRTNPVLVAQNALGAGLGDRTRRAIERAESVEQGLTLFLASPDFQRR